MPTIITTTLLPTHSPPTPPRASPVPPAGVAAWHFEQYLNEGVFIPAGCPHQVRNLASCSKVSHVGSWLSVAKQCTPDVGLSFMWLKGTRRPCTTCAVHLTNLCTPAASTRHTTCCCSPARLTPHVPADWNDTWSTALSHTNPFCHCCCHRCCHCCCCCCPAGGC
jgi:hypothetical protein